MAQTRTLIKVTIRRRDAPPITKLFYATYWHRRPKIQIAAGDAELVILDGRPAILGGPVSSLLALKSDVEGVEWWKIKSSAPSVLDSPVLPKRYLRPFELTTDGGWITTSLNYCKPAIVVYNPTERDAILDIFYATSEEADVIETVEEA